MPREDGWFKKGNKGKPKGAKHRSTAEIREFIQKVVDNNLERLEEDLDRMGPTARWMILDKISKYFLPTLSKNENQNTTDGQVTIKVEYADQPPTSLMIDPAIEVPTPLAIPDQDLLQEPPF
ncbi:hypothetical protein [Flaviaesturariibacter amylovorans]|uniref:Uncharacterized protein n=1 Tax=Flaviaesturariibacter amylovorans TaxID=1084520 RepID=A0ABP8GKN4_9BACT